MSHNVPAESLEPVSEIVPVGVRSELRADRDAPILLANADFYGTLAAARLLGRSGVPVYVASDRLLAHARWSRYAARVLSCPPMADAGRFLDWLEALGAREPGIVLYPTSDEAAFLYATRADTLSRSFLTYQPALEVLLGVLDKKRLYAAASEAGLEVPETWFPESDSDVERIAREAPMPLLVKPRTQVLSRTHSKGVVVRDRAELVARYRAFVAENGYGRAVLDRFSDAPRAMLQRYIAEASSHIYVLAAFIDRSGSIFAARSAMKIFQRPRSLGIGLCFESAPLDADLCDRVARLARAVGYFGLFQLEFIVTGGRRLLIDFNPRFYNQLAYDVARGLPLPHIVHAAARGDTEEMGRLVRSASQQDGGEGLIFCNAFGLGFMLTAQRAVNRISTAEASRWRQWQRAHEGVTIDPAVSPDDALPAIVDVATQLYHCGRHPRSFLRGLLREGA
jgi:predicted ATP-grasp superfamily ATP-dependent carboligase